MPGQRSSGGGDAAARARRAGAAEPTTGVPVVAWWSVGSALAALAVTLTATSAAYGYHRDELYFRMLPPAWGYVDQPPLTPLLVRLMSTLVADEVWAVRIPATVAALVGVLLVALLTRELGGGRLAQGLAAWGYGFASFPLASGTSPSPRALTSWRGTPPRCSSSVPCAGTSRGGGWPPVPPWVSPPPTSCSSPCSSSRWRRVSPSPDRGASRGDGCSAERGSPSCWPPTLVFQATHGWPQLAMGAALTARNGATNRVQMWWTLLILLGPVLVGVWVAGWVALIRRPEWRDVRFLGVAFPVLLALSFVSAGQPYYPLGLLTVLYAAGCVPVATWLRAGRRRAVVLALVAVNAVVSSLIALPLIPVAALGKTPVPVINQAVADQVGWPTYVAEIAAVRDQVPSSERAGLIVITTNYGEAGAVARYGAAYGLPDPYSGQNELGLTAPPPGLGPAVVVGRGAGLVAARNGTCTVEGTLDNRVGVRNEEQRQPIALCRPNQSWDRIWPQLRHLD